MVVVVVHDDVVVVVEDVQVVVFVVLVDVQVIVAVVVVEDDVGVVHVCVHVDPKQQQLKPLQHPQPLQLPHQHINIHNNKNHLLLLLKWMLYLL